MTEYPQYILQPFEGLTIYCIEILFPDIPQKPSLFQCLSYLLFGSYIQKDAVLINQGDVRDTIMFKK